MLYSVGRVAWQDDWRPTDQPTSGRPAGDDRRPTRDDHVIYDNVGDLAHVSDPTRFLVGHDHGMIHEHGSDQQPLPMGRRCPSAVAARQQ
jgi:hypothetical protein